MGKVSIESDAHRGLGGFFSRTSTMEKELSDSMGNTKTSCHVGEKQK